MQVVKPLSPPPPTPRRLTLASVVTGKLAEPYRMTIVGLDGVGKTTFAAGAPKPIFLEPEAGSGELDVARFPRPTTWQDMLDAVEELRTGKHDYQTLAVDTLDHAESMLWDEVCRKAGVDSIEAIGGGYGKGYALALDGWRGFLGALERLQRERRMNVVLLAHSFIKKFSNPEGDDYDRYILKLHDKSAALIREWCKAVYFAAFETYAVKEKGKSKARGVSTGARLIYTQRAAAFDAKDRYGVPTSMALDWVTFDSAAKAGMDIELSKKRVAAGLPVLSEKDAATARSAEERAGVDPVKLAQLANWVESRMPETTTRSES